MENIKSEIKQFAIFMICVIAIMAATLLFAVSCHADNPRVKTTDTTRVVDVAMTINDVIELWYDKDNKEYWVVYDNPDCFDYDNLAYLTGDEETYKDEVLHIRVDQCTWENLYNDIIHNHVDYEKYTLLEIGIPNHDKGVWKFNYNIVESKYLAEK